MPAKIARQADIDESRFEFCRIICIPKVTSQRQTQAGARSGATNHRDGWDGQGVKQLGNLIAPAQARDLLLER